MRGKVKSLRGDGLHGGITPAHAGKSIMLFVWIFITADHPRTRGEKTIFLLLHASVVGSPPHTRGKDFSKLGWTLNARITPAHAGKSVPRVPQFRTPRGSPPHTRGKGHTACNSAIGFGITPAHAGKSSSIQALIASAWDHPRACGEKIREQLRKLNAQGSPPRMRGKV